MSKGLKHQAQLRGGSWNNNADNCRVANRNNNNPDNRNNNNGLRLANAIHPSARTGKKDFCRVCNHDSPVSNPVTQVTNDFLQVSSGACLMPIVYYGIPRSILQALSKTRHFVLPNFGNKVGK